MSLRTGTATTTPTTTPTTTRTAASTTTSSARPPMPGRLGGWIEGLLVSLVAMLAGWSALWAWAPLIDEPHRFWVAALEAGLVIVVLGTLLRGVRVPAALVLAVQVVGCLALFTHKFVAGGGIGSWVPTPQRLSDLVEMVRQGSVTINHYSSPVAAEFTDVVVFLAVGGALMLLAVDLFVCGLRRVSLAGLPLLLTLTIPISVLVQRLSVVVFVVTAVLFLSLLLWQHRGRMHAWGREIGQRDVRSHTGGLISAAASVAAIAVAGALLLPGLVPVSHGIPFSGAGGSGNGDPSTNVTVVNPMIDIRRDLVRKTHTPMLSVRTNAPDPSYLRLAVLDEFTGTTWQPSTRHLPSSNDLSGPLPQAPGLTNAVLGVQTQWAVHLAPRFRTRWLPTPYPSIRIDARGDWRYDARTLDVANVGRPSQSEGLDYTVQAFAPDYNAELLRITSGDAPPEIQRPMTELPADLPSVIRRVAERVTRGAHSEYARAVALQDWFRKDGGFTYSTQAGPGSGMQLIADFITRGKVGYCEQFATAMAVMGRTLGIPARVVVGFVHPDRTGPQTYRYTSDNLHAWPEFYFDGAGWVRFEPTPAVRTGRAPAYTRPQQSASSPNQPPTLPLPSSSPEPEQSSSATAQQRHGATASGAFGWLVAGGVAILVAGIVLLPRTIRTRRRRRWLDTDQPPRDFARGAWLELRATAIDHGFDWTDHRSPRETLHKLRGRITADRDLRRSLDAFCEFIERARYSAAFDPSPHELERVRETVRDWSAAIEWAAPDRARRWAPWLPRTVFERQPDLTVSRVAAPDEREREREPVG